MKTLSTIAIAIVLLAFIKGAVLAQSGNDLFQQALVKERTEGNFAEAIKLYQRIIQKYGSDRKLAAKALFQMGQAQEKLGNAEARKSYEEIIRSYQDQAEVVADARRRLAAFEGVRSSEPLAVRHVFSTHEFPASITHDGRLVGMADGPNSAIGIRDMMSGQTKWLISGDPEWTEGECTIISPDERQVVYAWYPRRNNVLFGEVRVLANEPGSKPRILVPGKDEFAYMDPAAWTPDGKSILLVMKRRDETWQLGFVSVSDGSIRVLKSLGWRLAVASGTTSLSPDGKHIAYEALATNPTHPIPRNLEPSDPSGRHIYLLAVDGSSETDLTNFGGINRRPFWAPDGTHILFTSDRYGRTDLWSIPVQNGKATGPAAVVKRNFAGWAIGMTRSGTIYYGEGSDGGNIDQTVVIDLEPGGKVRGSTARAPESLIGNLPMWSPDGNFIAVQRPRGNSEILRVVYSVDTGEERRYDHPGIVAGPARWLSDGTAFLETIQNQNGTHSIYRVDVRTGEFKLVFTFEPSPDHGTIGQLAPDDNTLWVGTRDSRLIAFDLSRGQQTRAFKLPADISTIPGAALSPDGRSYALLRRGEKDVFTIATISTDGTDYRELYSAPSLGRITWSKGGILFSEKPPNSPSKIMRIPKIGDKAEFTGVEHPEFRSLSLSSDGSRLAFSSRESAGGWEVFALDNVMPVLKASK